METGSCMNLQFLEHFFRFQAILASSSVRELPHMRPQQATPPPRSGISALKTGSHGTIAKDATIDPGNRLESEAPETKR
jgi:hypothetical protein